MYQNKRFEKFDGRLRLEALIKSALAGIAAGGAVAFVASFVLWFLEFNGLIIAIALFAVASAVSGVVFYRRLFYPSVTRNARRLDGYGLEERLVTMVELEGDDSYIAAVQRADAIKSLGTLDKKQIKFRIPLAVIISFAVLLTAFAGMTTVEGLSEAGVIPTGSEVWLSIFPPEPLPEYTVEYTAGTGGSLVGNASQRVTQGEDAEPILAVADDGFVFYAWTDGERDPSRKDERVGKHISVSAVFVKLDSVPDEDEEGDQPDDAPGESSMSGDPDNPNQGAGVKYKEVNQVIDGETYYRDIYEEYYARAQEMIENGETVPQHILDIIEAYFNIIK